MKAFGCPPFITADAFHTNIEVKNVGPALSNTGLFLISSLSILIEMAWGMNGKEVMTFMNYLHLIYLKYHFQKIWSFWKTKCWTVNVVPVSTVGHKASRIFNKNVIKDQFSKYRRTLLIGVEVVKYYYSLCLHIFHQTGK